jgi:transposase-like protein
VDTSITHFWEEVSAWFVEEELAWLKRENERSRLERDFLKKAAAFFAKESRE